jgi:hypothetical protein
MNVFLTSTIVGMVSFTPRPLSPQYPFDRRLVASQSWCGQYGEVKNSRSYRDSNIDLSVVQPVAGRYTDCATATLLKCVLQRSNFEFIYVNIKSNDFSSEGAETVLFHNGCFALRPRGGKNLRLYFTSQGCLHYFT